MSQGAVSIIMSKPNSAARVDSSQAIVPHSVPSAIWRLRACTIRPSAIMKTAKLASNTRAAAYCNQNTYARKPKTDDGGSRCVADQRPRCDNPHRFVTAEHRLSINRRAS
jgi:hypothetical protein